MKRLLPRLLTVRLPHHGAKLLTASLLTACNPFAPGLDELPANQNQLLGNPVFVELPKFAANHPLAKRMQVLWLRYLTEIQDQTETISPDLLAEPALEEAVEYLRESAFSRGELAGYDRYWDVISSERTRIADALAEGKAEGRAEGKAEERVELTLEVARRMKAQGLDTALIQQITGLSVAEIAAL